MGMKIILYILYFIKSACQCVRPEVLLPLETPEISGLLQTSGLKEGIGRLMFSLGLCHSSMC